MKHGRNPNRSEKKVLMKLKKDWTEWLFIESTPNKEDKDMVDVVFRHKETNAELKATVRK